MGEMYSNGFRPSIDNENPVFFEYFDQLSQNEKKINSLNQSINRLEKQGYFLEDAQKEFYLLNKGRLSQSY